MRRKIQKRERMKTCPQCSTGYPDSQADCPIHGLPLNEIRELRPAEAGKPRPFVLRAEVQLAPPRVVQPFARSTARDQRSRSSARSFAAIFGSKRASFCRLARKSSGPAQNPVANPAR